MDNVSMEYYFKGKMIIRAHNCAQVFFCEKKSPNVYFKSEKVDELECTCA